MVNQLLAVELYHHYSAPQETWKLLLYIKAIRAYLDPEPTP